MKIVMWKKFQTCIRCLRVGSRKKAWRHLCFWSAIELKILSRKSQPTVSCYM